MIATSASTVFFGLLGPAMFHALAAPLAVSTCGAVIAGSAVVGWRWGARRGLASTPVEVAAASRRNSRLAALRLAGSRLDHGRRKLVSSARLLSAWVSRLVEPTVRRFAAKLATALERAIVRASKLLQ
jgi:hypothetical protein